MRYFFCWSLHYLRLYVFLVDYVDPYGFLVMDKIVESCQCQLQDSYTVIWDICPFSNILCTCKSILCITSPVRSVCFFIKLSIVKLSLSFINVWLFIQGDYCTPLGSWFDNYIFLFIQRPYYFIFFFCEDFSSLALYIFAYASPVQLSRTHIQVGRVLLDWRMIWVWRTCVQMATLIGCSFLMDPDWNQRKIIEVLVLLLKASRSWIILPISGAPGVGQKPSSFKRTEISVFVRVWLDKLTIPFIYLESLSLMISIH